MRRRCSFQRARRQWVAAARRERSPAGARRGTPAAGPDPPPPPLQAELGAVSTTRVVKPKHGVGVRVRSGSEREKDRARAPRASTPPLPLPASQVEDLFKEYVSARGTTVMGARGFTLDLGPNALTALVGPSGSGKTTLLRLIAGLEAPTRGRILFDGVDVTDVPARARRVGVVFQGYALFRHMTVADNIAFGPRMLRLPGDVRARVAELLDLIELPHIAHRLPGELSGGQRQRVALARALAADPRVLLLDEPFSALDPEVRVALRTGLVDILRRAGVTAVMVSHDQEEAFAVADDVVVFHRGAPLARGPPEALAADPGSPFVMDFVHEANRLPAGSLLVRAARWGGDEPMVLVPPCAISARSAPPRGSSSVLATVVDASFAGETRKYLLRLADGCLVRAATPTRGDDGETTEGGGRLLAVGGRAHVWCEPGRLMGYREGDLDP